MQLQYAFMQQEHKLSPSPGHHRGCYGLLDRPWWRRFDQSLGKDRTIKKIPRQVRAQPCGLDLHLNSSLFPWCAGQGAKQAAEPLGTQRLAPCPLHTSLGRVWCCSFAKCILSPVKSNGETLNQRVSTPLPWPLRHLERKSCAPSPHSQGYLPLLHSSTLHNANTLPSWVAEKWAIKRNTWENRRDSTEDQGTCFFPGWPSYLTNWQRYSLMMK